MDQSVPKKKNKKMTLSLWSKMGYGLGHVLNDLCASMWFTYSLLFFIDVMSFSSVNAGILMLVGQVADAASTPIVGLLSDRTSMFCLMKYGRRKAWHLVGTVCVLCAMPFMYSPCIQCQEAPEWHRLLYYCFFVSLFQFGWAAVQISHLALVTELTSDQMERTGLLSLRNSFTILSNLIAYAVTWTVLGMDNETERLCPKDLFKFQEIVYSLCVGGSVASLLFHLSVKEEEDEPLLSEPELSSPAPLRSSILSFFSRWKLYQVALIYIFTRLFCNISQSYITLYLHKVLTLNSQSIAIVPFVMYSASFLTSWITTPLNQFCGRKLAFAIGNVIGIIGCVWIWFGHGSVFKLYLIYAVASLFGAATSILLVTSLSITADLIGDDVGNSAFIYGIMSFGDKFSCGLVIMGIQLLSTEGSQMFYKEAMVYVCGLAAIFGILVVLTTNSRRLPPETLPERTE